MRMLRLVRPANLWLVTLIRLGIPYVPRAINGPNGNTPGRDPRSALAAACSESRRSREFEHIRNVSLKWAD
ncbi:hypothetical protein BJV77DRAFT_674908 [Russula vinacea]|nr:hypothetical protein BJV77DRAFT_674908 [Russula vinacea]